MKSLCLATTFPAYSFYSAETEDECIEVQVQPPHLCTRVTRFEGWSAGDKSDWMSFPGYKNAQAQDVNG